MLQLEVHVRSQQVQMVICSFCDLAQRTLPTLWMIAVSVAVRRRTALWKED